MGLLMQNPKPHVSHNGSKSISNHIVGCNLFPNMGSTEKNESLHDFKGWPQMQ
jgi:hypothetical protein